MFSNVRRADLPVELVQQILRFCPPGLWSTLMLLSTSWREIIETERYGDIHIYFQPSPLDNYGVPRHLRLLSTLEQSPRLARRVQSLTLSMSLADGKWPGRCRGHAYQAYGPCKGEERLPSQILSSITVRRDELIRKSLGWTGLASQVPRSHYMHSEIALRKVIARGLVRCGVRADENATVFFAALVLALQHCANLHTLDLRDEFRIPVFYRQVLSAAINAAPKLRHLTISQAFITKELFAPTNRDDLAHALARSFSQNQPMKLSVSKFGSGNSLVGDHGKLVVIYGKFGWTVTPHELAKLRWLSAQGVSVVTKRGDFTIQLYISHYGDAEPSALARYIADVTGYCKSLLLARNARGGNPMQLYRGAAWYSPPGQIQISLCTPQLDSHLESAIGAISSMGEWVTLLDLIFYAPDDVEETGELPQVSAMRLMEIVARLQQVERIILQNGPFSRVDYAVRASRTELLAAGRAAGMRKLKEVMFLGERWQYGYRLQSEVLDTSLSQRARHETD